MEAILLLLTAVLPVEFENDIIPVFTKAGCNTGACHGAAVGRGGFKLSLYGGDPAADYDSIVNQLEGRRINLASPDDSLLVLKPTEAIEHGGGYRLDPDGPGAQLLRDWVAQGGDQIHNRDLEQVSVFPRSQVVESIPATVQLGASADFSDGSKRDVTAWTVFSAEDPSAVEVDPVTAMATVQRRGRHIVIARYLDQVIPIELIVPLAESPIDLSQQTKSNFIDDEVLKLLSTLRLPPSELVDDATFLRRVSLDLTGRLPSSTSVNKFLEEEGPKRSRLIDQMLASEEFNDLWTLQLANLLRIHTQPKDKQGAMAYHGWLHDQIAAGAGYDDLARKVITARGDSHVNGPANFYRTVPDARQQAEFMSELFMGNRLRCANCHNHPLDRWTQDDYHGLAAIFAKIGKQRVVKLNPSGEVIHPRTGSAAVARIPGEYFISADVSDGTEELARWLTDRENPYFSKAIVNRLWKSMMGRGLVEPADDLRATNPATHPVLLNRLAEDFAANGYRLRHTLALIANSATYQRSSIATEDNNADDRFYSRAATRALQPEVLADAISDVLDVADKYGDEPSGTRAVSLFDPATISPTLDILGRCSRQESCETTTGSTGGLPRKLHLFNGALLNARIGSDAGRLSRMIAADRTPQEIVEAFYVAALSRRPTEQETEYWNEQIRMDRPASSQRDVFEDFVWSLLTCNEFVTNH